VVRSVRDDPLADRFARGFIDAAQFAAAREFQKFFGIAERGPRAIQLTEAVDGNPVRETLTNAQLNAGKWLAKCYRQLGAYGSALIHNSLINGRTTKQIAAARGLTGPDWERYIARRLRECLDTLAVVFGFASGDRKARPVTDR
jgi:hypothetical protein